MVQNINWSLRRRIRKNSYLLTKGSYFYGRYYSPYDSGCVNVECELGNNSDADEQESASEYSDGGYLAVEIGAVLHDRYQVIRKLGWGGFSTVWLCWDTATEELVALKIVKDHECDRLIALGEVAMLRAVHETGNDKEPGKSRIVRLKDSFELPGQNCFHVCMAFEVLGKSLLSFVDYKRKRGIDTKSLKVIVRQVLEGLAFLHDKCRLVHTDIKPENLLMWADEEYVRGLARDVVERVWSGKAMGVSMVCANLSPSRVNLRQRLAALKRWLESWTWSGGDPALSRTGACGLIRVKLADLGNAVPLDYEMKSKIQTEPYRAPEVILGAGFGCSADLWSVACTIFELATGSTLFEPTKSQTVSRPENHLACIVQVAGPIPRTLRLRGRHSYRYFTKFGSLKHLGRVKKIGLKKILVDECSFGKRQARELADFLEPMLNVDPAKRPTAAECLLHPWLQR